MKSCLYLITLFAGSLLASGASATRVVPENKLVPLIAQALSDSFELEQGKLMLESSRAMAPVSVPVDTANISIKLVAQPYTRPTSFMKAQYSVIADGVTVGQQTSFFRAQLIQDVWIAQQVIQRGVTLSEAKLVKKKTDVINLRDSIWIGKPDTSQQLVTTVSAGTVLQERHLRRTPAIYRNQTVEAVLSHKALEIRLRVLALEDGAPGDVIRLRNTSSAKEIRGTVINSREVKVTF